MVSQNRYAEVVGPAGLHGSVDTRRWGLDRDPSERPPDEARVRVLLDDGRDLLVPRGALRPLADGRFELAAAPEPGEAHGPVAVIPIVQEQPRVTTRAVDRGGVRVRKVVREREEVVNPPLRHEQATIDRVAIQREVSGPMPVREEDGVVVIPLVEEVMVVRKAWVLREEIRIRKQRLEVERPRRVSLRSEDVIVERLEPEASPGAEREPESGGPGGAPPREPEEGPPAAESR